MDDNLQLLVLFLMRLIELIYYFNLIAVLYYFIFAYIRVKDNIKLSFLYIGIGIVSILFGFVLIIRMLLKLANKYEKELKLKNGKL